MNRIIVFCFLMVSMSLSAFAQNVPAIQRFGVVGVSEDGLRLAVMVTYFGPTSGSPHATLRVFEAGRPEPLLDSMNVYWDGGGETELAELARLALKQNKGNLEKLGIIVDSPGYSDAHFVHTPDSKMDNIRGRIDIENAEVFDFRIENVKSKTCDVDQSQINISLGTTKLELIPSKPSLCASGMIQLRNIILTKSALWFFVLKNSDAMGISFYQVNVAGLAFEKRIEVPAAEVLKAARSIVDQTGPGYKIEGELSCRSFASEFSSNQDVDQCVISIVDKQGKRREADVKNIEPIFRVLYSIQERTGPAYEIRLPFVAESVTGVSGEVSESAWVISGGL